MHHLAGLCLKTDDSAGMVCLHLRLIQLDRPVLNRRGEREWLIELDHEIILEVTGNTARVLRGITDDLTFRRQYLYIRAFIESVDDDIRFLGFRECKAELSRTFRRNQLGSHVMIGQIDLIIIRCSHFAFVREPASPFLLVEDQAFGSRHNGELPVIVHPRARLMGLLESPDLIRIVTIGPAVAHLAGLGSPEVHTPRHGRGRIGISGR